MVSRGEGLTVTEKQEAVNYECSMLGQALHEGGEVLDSLPKRRTPLRERKEREKRERERERERERVKSSAINTHSTLY